MSEIINILTAEDKIQAQLDVYKNKITSTLPQELRNQNYFGDFAVAIWDILGLTRLNPSKLLQAVNKWRDIYKLQQSNNINYNSAQEKSA